MSSSLNQGEDEGVADELSDNPSRVPKDVFPKLGEQGDKNVRSKDLMIYAQGNHTH